MSESYDGPRIADALARARHRIERDEALLRQALEALERCVETCFHQYAHEQIMSRPEHFVNQTAAALRERLGEKA